LAGVFEILLLLLALLGITRTGHRIQTSWVRERGGIVPGIGIQIPRLGVVKAGGLFPRWIGSHEPSQRRRVVARIEVIQPAFGVALFAGEVHGASVTPGAGQVHTIGHVGAGFGIAGIAAIPFGSQPIGEIVRQ
jgi:hypothetical protein